MKLKHMVAAAALATVGMSASADVVLSEGFEDVAGLFGAGWVQVNEGSPIGDTNWFQGNTGVFTAAAGPEDSYAAANFLSAAAGGSISNWLMTPEVMLGSTTTLAFNVRAAGDDFLDTVEIYFSDNGASTSTADFVLIGSYSSTVDEGWVGSAIDVVSGAASGRFAFRHVIGNTDIDGNYVGIDSVFVRTATTAVSAPASLALAGLALAALGATRRRAA